MAQQKWNLGDIHPPDRKFPAREVQPRRRRLEDVRVPSEYAASDDATREHETEEMQPRRFLMRRDASAGASMKKRFFLGSIVVVLALVGLSVVFFLRGTELTVYPEVADVIVEATFTAHQYPETNMLGYELLTLEETGERTVAATGEEQVEERAGGEITLYNAFSSDPQRLIKNTRFESPEGRIFRIQDSVVIPGYTTTSAGEKVPGTLTTKVFADEAGDAHNIGPARFSIPGLKGSPQFEAMYAESKSPMQGGFVGMKLIVEDGELTRTKETIQAELREKLLGRLHGERPAGFVVYENAARVRFEPLPSVDGGDRQATIRERAILEVPIFAEADFARYLAQNTSAEYGGEEVRIADAQSLVFSYVTASSTEAISGKNARIDFTLSGEARIVWTYDQNQLRNDLAGATKEEVPNILLKYQPAIDRATTVMRPFWRQSFPKDPTKIKIIEIVDSPEK